MNETNPDDLQGEGNYDASRRYDKSAREFVESGKVDEAAHGSRPSNAEEADELIRAEREGKAHSKGEDSPSGSEPQQKSQSER